MLICNGKHIWFRYILYNYSDSITCIIQAHNVSLTHSNNQSVSLFVRWYDCDIAPTFSKNTCLFAAAAVIAVGHAQWGRRGFDLKKKSLLESLKSSERFTWKVSQNVGNQEKMEATIRSLLNLNRWKMSSRLQFQFQFSSYLLFGELSGKVSSEGSTEYCKAIKGLHILKPPINLGILYKIILKLYSML